MMLVLVETMVGAGDARVWSSGGVGESRSEVRDHICFPAPHRLLSSDGALQPAGKDERSAKSPDVRTIASLPHELLCTFRTACIARGSLTIWRHHWVRILQPGQLITPITHV